MGTSQQRSGQRAAASAMARTPVSTQVLFALLLILGMAASLGLQGGTYRDPEYLIESWETEQGLPENSATAMVQAPDGYLWFGTFYGLVRFDGVQFTVFDPSNTPGLPSAGIVNLHLDTRRRLWVSTYRGLVVSEPDRWATFQPMPGWTGDFVRTFSENAGVVCATSFDGRVFREQAGRLEQLPEPPGAKGGGYLGYVDRGGGIWVAQIEGSFFGRWDGSQWQRSALAGALFPGFVAMGSARDGGLLVAKSDELLRLDGERIVSRLGFRSPQAIEEAWELQQDHQGVVWISAKGLYRVQPSGDIRCFTATNGLTYDSLRFTFEDREHNLWVGTSGGGLMRFKARTFVTYGEETGLGERNVKAVLEERPGRILIGTFRSGLFAWERGRISPVETNCQPFSQWVQCLLLDRQSNLWVGGYAGNAGSGGLTVITPTERRQISEADIGAGDVRALFHDSRDRIWIGARDTVTLFAEGRFQVQHPPDGIRLGGVRCFTEDPQKGVIWAGTAEGLFHFVEGRWREIQDAAGSSVENIRCLRAGLDGSLWIGADRAGLLRLKDGRWSSVTEGQGLPVSNIGCILEDDSGHWWLGSNRGVVRASFEDIVRVADGVLTSLPCQIFNLSDGLASVECTMGFQSTGVKESRGRLWFATLKGVAVADPHRLQLNTNPPPVLIEGIRVEDAQGRTQYYAGGDRRPIAVPPATREVVVLLAGLSFPAPEKMRFAYRLEGVDREWKDLGNRRTLYLYKPAPGRYRLQVKAANNDGVWNETGATIAFTVQPFFWQTLWFRALAVLAFGGSIAAAVGMRQRTRLRRAEERLQQQQALVESEAFRKRVFDSSPIPVVVMDAATWRYIDCNEAAVAIYRYGSREATLGRTPLDVSAPTQYDGASSADGVRSYTEQAKAAGHVAFEWRHQRPDGSLWDAEVHLMSFQSGQQPLLQFTLQDITERKRAEEMSRRSAERAQRQRAALVRVATTEGIAAGGTLQGGLQVLTEAACEALGVARAGVWLLSDDGAEMRCADLFEAGSEKHSDGMLLNTVDYPRYFQALRAESRVYASDAQTDPRSSEFAEGYLIPLGITSMLDASIHTGGRMVGVVCLEHIGSHREWAADEEAFAGTLAAIAAERLVSAARHQVELDRAALQTQLIQAQKMEAVGQLAGGVAHDFNNILTAVLMNLNLLQGEPGLSPEVREGLTEIEGEAKRAANLTRQLLLFSRRHVLQTRTLDLNSLLGNLVKMLRRLIGEQIALELSGASCDVWIEADPGMIEQVVMNLVVNARDAMPKGGRITLNVQALEVDPAHCARNHEARPGSFACLVVADTGDGMDDATQQRIFEPFFTTKGAGRGTGLGLATVYGIVKQHKGWLEVQSAVGQGTTFRVYLPLCPVVPAGEPSLPKSKFSPRGTETILLVEDADAVRRATASTLRQLGYRVVEAANSHEALALWPRERANVDLLLTDMVMPGEITGQELGQRLRRDKPSLKCLLVSGYSRDLAQAGFSPHQETAFMPKPLDPAALAEKIRDCLDRR